MRGTVVVIVGPVERALDILETGIWSGGAVDGERKHVVVITFPKSKRGVISRRSGAEGPGILRCLLVNRNNGWM